MGNVSPRFGFMTSQPVAVNHEEINTTGVGFAENDINAGSAEPVFRSVFENVISAVALAPVNYKSGEKNDIMHEFDNNVSMKNVCLNFTLFLNGINNKMVAKISRNLTSKSIHWSLNKMDFLRCETTII